MLTRKCYNKKSLCQPQYANAISTKIPVSLFVEFDKINLKFIWKYKGTTIDNYADQHGGILTLLDIKTCKIIVIKHGLDPETDK